MKIICQQEELARYLQVVARAIAAKSTLPILTGIYLETKEDLLRCVATDLEISIEVKVPQIQVIQPGTIVLPGKTFVEIVRHLPAVPVEIATNDDSSMVTISSQTSSYQLPIFPVEEYPAFSEIRDGDHFEVNGDALREAIRQTIYATIIEDPRPFLSSILWEITPGKLRLVATDVNRLSVRDLAINNSNQRTALVPVRSLREIANIFGSSGAGKLQVFLNEKQIFIESSGITFSSRLVEAQFPRYEQVIPKEFNGEIEIDRTQFISALERTALVSNSIKISILVDKIVITAKEPDKGRSYEELQAEVNGVEMEIGFNVRFLLDFLKSLDDEVVNFKYLQEQKPVLMIGKTSKDYRYIVMPLKLSV
ncbi:MAG TPA: DNA polymerase III subunit beta [Bacillota bacterium]